jgi:putative endonuclease
MMSRPIGFAHEDRALEYLKQQGLKLIVRNFLCKLGEIDLIMKDSANKLIFVEVRYRGSKNYGSSAASVSRGKQIRLVRTANWYLRAHYPGAPPLCRFDVVAINGDNESDLNWIKNAFYT